MAWAEDIAKEFKSRDNKTYQGPQLGTVISPPPEIQVQLGETILLDKNKLVIAAHVLADYQRETEIEGKIKLTATQDVGTVNDYTSIPPGTPKYVDGINLNNVDTKIEGTLKYTNTLNKGDVVILVPAADGQSFFLIDRAVRL